jgi:glyoxalase/bleomycin resistance protein/dioxygenase superfamily protein
MLSTISIGDDFWSSHIWQPGQSATILLRVKAKADVAVRARPATRKQRSHDEPRDVTPPSRIVHEFLEYLTPRDGRVRPADIHANDIVHWQTTIATDDVDLLAKKLQEAHVRFISPGVVAIPKNKAGFLKGALVSDPDGHSVLLIQK